MPGAGFEDVVAVGLQPLRAATSESALRRRRPEPWRVPCWLPWGEIKRNQNPLWEKGYQFYCVTPKTRHRVHSQWSVNDWVQIYESNFGDPYRMDKRTPGVGEHQLHIYPQAAKDRGINDGDYIYVDGNPVDRPYRGWKPSDPFYKVARLMIRCKYNPAFPYHVTMAKHAPYVSTAKSVKGHEPRPDGRAIAVDTGYQSNFRYGAQQSFTRSWLMPMHQTDSLPGKHAIACARSAASALPRCP